MSFLKSIPKIPPNASTMLSNKTHYHIFIFSYDVEWNSVVCFEGKIGLQICTRQEGITHFCHSI